MIELDFVPQIDSSNQIDERCLDLQKKKISQVSKKKVHVINLYYEKIYLSMKVCSVLHCW